MIKKIRTYLRLKDQVRIMILQVFILSLYTWFLFKFLTRCAKFGQKITEAPYKQTPNPKADSIARAIKISSKYIPWKNVCRHQAYQAKLLCNYYKVSYRIFIGFKKDKLKNEIQAHAWTEAGSRIITGFCNPEEYTIQNIYCN